MPTEIRNGILVQKPSKWGWFSRADFKIRKETGLVPESMIDERDGTTVQVLLDRGQRYNMATTGQAPEGFTLPRQGQDVS